MFPGLATKVSEEVIALTATCAPAADVAHITSTASTTKFTTILPPFGGLSGIWVVINRSGNNITTVTTGNIVNAVTIPVNQPCVFIYSALTGKYYAGAIS